MCSWPFAKSQMPATDDKYALHVFLRISPPLPRFCRRKPLAGTAPKQSMDNYRSFTLRFHLTLALSELISMVRAGFLKLSYSEYVLIKIINLTLSLRLNILGHSWAIMQAKNNLSLILSE